MKLVFKCIELTYITLILFIYHPSKNEILEYKIMRFLRISSSLMLESLYPSTLLLLCCYYGLVRNFIFLLYQLISDNKHLFIANFVLSIVILYTNLNNYLSL